MHNYIEEILFLKEKILKLERDMEKLQATNFKNIPLSFVAKELNISRQTLTYFVKSKFEPEVDFYIKDNRIFLNMGILSSIKEHYNA